MSGNKITNTIVRYSEEQLEHAIEFISKYNVHFLGEKDIIKGNILDLIKTLSEKDDAVYYQTMGLIVVCEREFEGVDLDSDICYIEIYVDPSLWGDMGKDV